MTLNPENFPGKVRHGRQALQDARKRVFLAVQTLRLHFSWHAGVHIHVPTHVAGPVQIVMKHADVATPKWDSKNIRNATFIYFRLFWMLCCLGVRLPDLQYSGPPSQTRATSDQGTTMRFCCWMIFAGLLYQFVK